MSPFRPRLLTRLPKPFTPHPLPAAAAAEWLQHCVICKGPANGLRKLEWDSLKVLKDRGILNLVEQYELATGRKAVCDGCCSKIKKISTHQNRIRNIEHEISGIVEELKERSIVGHELPVIQGNSQAIVTSGHCGQQASASSVWREADSAAQAVPMEIEPQLFLEPQLPKPTTVAGARARGLKPKPVEGASASASQTQNGVAAPPKSKRKVKAKASDPPKSYFPLYRYGTTEEIIIPEGASIVDLIDKDPATPKTKRADRNSRVTCAECKLSFDQLSYARHLKYSPKHASEESAKRCEPCAINFPSLSLRMDHDREKHPELFPNKYPVPMDIPTIKCSACSRQFYHEDGLKKHFKKEGCKTVEEARLEEREALRLKKVADLEKGLKKMDAKPQEQEVNDLDDPKKKEEPAAESDSGEKDGNGSHGNNGA